MVKIIYQLTPSSHHLPQRHVRSKRLLGRGDVADVWPALRRPFQPVVQPSRSGKRTLLNMMIDDWWWWSSKTRPAKTRWELIDTMTDNGASDDGNDDLFRRSHQKTSPWPTPRATSLLRSSNFSYRDWCAKVWFSEIRILLLLLFQSINYSYSRYVPGENSGARKSSRKKGTLMILIKVIIIAIMMIIFSISDRYHCYVWWSL